MGAGWVRQWTAITGLALLAAPACGRRQFPTEDELFREALARFDADGDGRLSAVEYQRFEPRRENFDAMDTDRNGAVDSKELGAWLVATEPRPLGFP